MVGKFGNGPTNKLYMYDVYYVIGREKGKHRASRHTVEILSYVYTKILYFLI